MIDVEQLLEVDGGGVLGLAGVVEEGPSSEHGGPLGRVHRVPEVVAVAVGAERGVGRASRLRAQPPAAAARVGGVREPPTPAGRRRWPP